MQTSPSFGRDESPASERLAALSAKTGELLASRKALVRGMNGDATEARILELMAGVDLDETLQKKHGNLQAIDENLDVLRAAIRRVASELELEKVEAGRAAREEKKAAYVRALKTYHGAVKKVFEASRAVRKINRNLKTAGHAGFDIPVFPGFNVGNQAARDKMFLDIVRLKLDVEL